MNHCVRLFLLFTPSLVGLGLLGVALCTNLWTISLESRIPQENSLKILHNDQRLYSTIVPVPLSRGLFDECIAYREVRVKVLDNFDFRTKSQEKTSASANETCADYQFTCKTGFAIVRPTTRCIERQRRCDHIVDCEDHSDEMSCTDEIFPCPTGYVKCQDGKSCYRRAEQTCDGVFNCLDKSDEENCNEEKCQQNKHVFCPREGQCARRDNSKRCDGIVDCADNSDEEYCPSCNPSVPTAFSCDSKCFPEKYLCDGIVHCSNLRDESNCREYTTTSNTQKRDKPNGEVCMEQRLDLFNLYPPQDPLGELYPDLSGRSDHLQLMHYFKLIVFYGICGALVFLLFAVISLFFFGCCRRNCISVPFFLYGFWMLLAWICISTALISFVLLWLMSKQAVVDDKKTPALEVMINQNNPTLREIEMFGLSFWLACGSALATFIGLLLSYCICCTLGSSRADDKEYEIMHMQSY